MKLDDIFEKTQLLPTIPRVVQELIHSLNHEDVDIGEITQKIAIDQVLTAKLLRLANSSYYGSTRQIAAVDDAVTLLGFNTVRTLVIACGMTSAFSSSTVDLSHFWQRSLHTATFAKWLAKHSTPPLHPETSFTAGLMHGIGWLLLNLVYPHHTAAKFSPHQGNSARIQVRHEQEAFEIDHCTVGAELARRWNLPLEIQLSIAQYPDPLSHHPIIPYAVLVHIAVYLADNVEHGHTVAEVAENFPLHMGEPFGYMADKTVAAYPELIALAQQSDMYLG